MRRGPWAERVVSPPLELRHRALGRIGRRRDAALAGRGPRARQEAEQGRQHATGVTRGEAAKALGRGWRGTQAVDLTLESDGEDEDEVRLVAEKGPVDLTHLEESPPREPWTGLPIPTN